MDNIYCPIFILSGRSNQVCLEGECGFWSKSAKKCGIACLGSLDGINNKMSKVQDALTNISTELDSIYGAIVRK